MHKRVTSPAVTPGYKDRDPDVHLMLRVGQDEERAFEELVQRYRPRVHSWLIRHLKDAELAEDVAQETFLRAYLARSRYRPQARFSTWLLTIANNLAKNALRDRYRSFNQMESAAHFLLADQGVSAGMRTDEPLHQLEGAEARCFVTMAIRDLNERQRIAILRKHFDQKSYAEIATELETTPDAVKALLWRARNNLRELLEPYVRAE